MAVVQTSGRIFVNGADRSQYLTSFEITQGVDLKDTTNFASGTAREFVPGQIERSIKADGFYADNPALDANSIDKLFSDTLAAASHQLISICTTGAIAVGSAAVMLNTLAAKYGVNVKVGELMMAMFEAKASKQTSLGDFARGIWLMSQTVTAPVNGTGYDNTVATSVGYVIQIHNTDADGGITGKVQHSVNNSTWVDLFTFAGMAANSAQQAIDTTTTVNRYQRAIVTAIGGTTCKLSVAMKVGYTGS